MIVEEEIKQYFPSHYNILNVIGLRPTILWIMEMVSKITLYFTKKPRKKFTNAN